MPRPLPFLCTLVLSVPALAAAEVAISDELLLGEIDALCGDTWCESDFDFAFSALSFRDGAALLDFELFLHPDDAATGHAEQRFAGRCRLPGHASAADVATAIDGRLQLQEVFYDELTDCLQDAIDRTAAQLSTMLPAGLKSATCAALLLDDPDADLGGAELAAACAEASLYATSLQPARWELVLQGRTAAGHRQLCTMQLARHAGAEPRFLGCASSDASE